MNVGGLGIACGSLASLFGANSMKAWTQTLLVEDRHCMDCKAQIEGFAGTLEFQGRLPHVDIIGHLCEACLERREEIRRYRLSLVRG
jgi:hypothetical protein